MSGKKVKAVVFSEPEKYETKELTLKKPGPGDIEVETLVSSVSPGTERWILKGKHIGTRFPCVPGYHRIGIVTNRGKDVRNFERGDVVYGFANKWKEQIHSMWGAHVSASVGKASEYWFISSKLPRNFELETTSFSILAGVAVRGINVCDIVNGERVLIIGGGFIAICAAQLASLRGAHPVIMDNSQERVAFARKFADSFSTEEKGVKHKLENIAPEGFDVLYDTAGAPSTTDMLVPHVKKSGRMLLQAQYFDKERCAIDLDAIKIREITMRTTCGVTYSDWKDTFELINSRVLKIAPLITHRFGSGEIIKGYDLLAGGGAFNMGIVFHWR